LIRNDASKQIRLKFVDTIDLKLQLTHRHSWRPDFSIPGELVQHKSDVRRFVQWLDECFPKLKSLDMGYWVFTTIAINYDEEGMYCVSMPVLNLFKRHGMLWSYSYESYIFQTYKIDFTWVFYGLHEEKRSC